MGFKAYIHWSAQRWKELPELPNTTVTVETSRYVSLLVTLTTSSGNDRFMRDMS
jgi:hypothetical protein